MNISTANTSRFTANTLCISPTADIDKKTFKNIYKVAQSSKVLSSATPGKINNKQFPTKSNTFKKRGNKLALPIGKSLGGSIIKRKRKDVSLIVIPPDLQDVLKSLKDNLSPRAFAAEKKAIIADIYNKQCQAELRNERSKENNKSLLLKICSPESYAIFRHLLGFLDIKSLENLEMVSKGMEKNMEGLDFQKNACSLDGLLPCFMKDGSELKLDVNFLINYPNMKDRIKENQLDKYLAMVYSAQQLAMGKELVNLKDKSFFSRQLFCPKHTLDPINPGAIVLDEYAACEVNDFLVGQQNGNSKIIKWYRAIQESNRDYFEYLAQNYPNLRWNH